MVDSSGSINRNDGGNWDRVKSFVNSIIDGLGVSEAGTHVAVVEFGNNGILIFDFDFSFDVPTIQTAVDGMRFLDANTNTSGGLYIVLSQLLFGQGGNRENVQDFVIVITDGVPTRDVELTEPYAEEIQAVATMFSIGITNEINEETLQYLSSPPRVIDETYFIAEDFLSLEPIVDQIVGVTCSEIGNLKQNITCLFHLQSHRIVRP